MNQNTRILYGIRNCASTVVEIKKNCEAILAENVAGRSLSHFAENVAALGSIKPHQVPTLTKGHVTETYPVFLSF